MHVVTTARMAEFKSHKNKQVKENYEVLVAKRNKDFSRFSRDLQFWRLIKHTLDVHISELIFIICLYFCPLLRERFVEKHLGKMFGQTL